MSATEISWISLAAGLLLLAIPAGIFIHYKTGLFKSFLISYGRMIVQLSLIGLYLEFIFELNNLWVNFAWIIIMILAADYTIIRRSEMKLKYFWMPVAAGVIAGLMVTASIFIFLIMQEEFFIARFMIPISGMIIGNSLNSSIIGLRTFYRSLVKEKQRYQFLIMCGASKAEAIFEFFSEALKAAFGPTIGSTATIGLIWLPGMMTGQILGGADPVTAIKYQILIISSILVGGSITVVLSINLSKRFVFDEYSRLETKFHDFEEEEESS